MLQFFYKTRNIFGLILAIVPVLSFVSTDRPFSFFLLFLCSMAAATPLLCAALRRISFRRWILLCCLPVLIAMVLLTRQNSPAPAPLPPVLLGIGACGILLLLPPNMAMGWFRLSKTPVLGIIWSISLMLLPAGRFLCQEHPYAFLTFSAASMLTAVLFLQRPPVSFSRRDNPLTAGRFDSFLKPAFFTASAAAATGIAFSMTLLDGREMPGGVLSNLAAGLIVLCFAAAPLLSSLLVEKKGIFSGCVYLIFLCEGAMLCLGSFSQALFLIAGRCLLALAAGSLPVVLPVLTFYLYGHINYLESFGRLALSIPAGLVFALPFSYMAGKGLLSVEEPVVFLLFLLVLSFFCIFFAWKKRFVILKNEIL